MKFGGQGDAFFSDPSCNTGAPNVLLNTDRQKVAKEKEIRNLKAANHLEPILNINQ